MVHYFFFFWQRKFWRENNILVMFWQRKLWKENNLFVMFGRERKLWEESDLLVMKTVKALLLKT